MQHKMIISITGLILFLSTTLFLQSSQAQSAESEIPASLTLKWAGGIDESPFAETLVLQNSHLFAGIETKLVLFDVTEPNELIKLNDLEFTDNVEDIVVVENYVYVVTGNSGFHILEVSDEETLSEVGTLNTLLDAQSIAVQGQFAYIASSTEGLFVVDISNPTSPVEIGFFAIETGLDSIEVAGNYAYTAGGVGCFQGSCYVTMSVLDISNPESMSLLGTHSMDGTEGHLALSENYVFISGNGVEIVDISDPTNPTFAGNFSNLPFPCCGGIEAKNGYVFLGGWEGGLVIVDATIPLTPIIVGTYDTFGLARNVVISENGIAYVADGPNGIQVIDVTAPSLPMKIGEYVLTGVSSGQITMRGDGYAYIASSESGQEGLYIVDVSNPNTPVLVNYYRSTPLKYQDVDVWDWFFNQNTYAFVASGYDGLRVLDITDTTNPIEVGSYENPPYFSANRIEIKDNFAYVMGDTQGLSIFDISNPYSPMPIGNIGINNANELKVVDNYSFVSGGLGLSIVDISNPTNPFLAASFITSGNASDITLQDHYAFILEVGIPSELTIIDIADPLNPIEISSIPDIFSYSELAVGDEYLFVSSWPYGPLNIQVFNISNPQEPKALDIANFEMDAFFDVIEEDSHLYGVGYDGLTILEFKSPIQLYLPIIFKGN